MNKYININEYTTNNWKQNLNLKARTSKQNHIFATDPMV